MLSLQIYFGSSYHKNEEQFMSNASEKFDGLCQAIIDLKVGLSSEQILVNNFAMVQEILESQMEVPFLNSKHL